LRFLPSYTNVRDGQKVSFTGVIVAPSNVGDPDTFRMTHHSVCVCVCVCVMGDEDEKMQKKPPLIFGDELALAHVTRALGPQDIMTSGERMGSRGEVQMVKESLAC